MEIENSVVLSPQQIEFFRYFIRQYHKHIEKGEFEKAHHCSVGILLQLEKEIL